MHLSPKHYATFSAWLERLGLAIVVSLVFQQLLTGESLADASVVLSLLATFLVYIIAFLLQIKL